jgi:hypothetical protein
MNHRINFNFGGGLFSYMMILLENLSKWDNVGVVNSLDNLYVNNTGRDHRSVLSNIGYNIFDYILEQDLISGGVLNCVEGHPVYPSEFFTKQDRYKEISKKYLKFNQDILLNINSFVKENFKTNMLGVHIRTTDMNHHHSYLGVVNNKHYLDKIDEVLSNNSFGGIFVASDNYETIKILKKEYGDLVVNYDTNFRSDTSLDDSLKNAMNNWVKTPQFFVDSFIDGMLLSNCDESIGRISLFNWFSQSVHTSKIKKYHHIDGNK